MGWGDRLAVTVEELDRHVCAVLCEERNGLVTCLDGLDHVPDRGVLADEVAEIQPEAMGPRVNGYMTVDYSKLEGWNA